MNEKEFDDKIKRGLKDPDSNAPKWSKMTAMLNSDMPLDDITEFDEIIQNDLENLQTNNTPNWDRMESIISTDPTLLNKSFDLNIAAKVASLDAINLGSPNWDRMESELNQPMSTEEVDMLLAAKVLNFTPSGTSKWDKFELELEKDLPLTKERNLFDNQLKRALTGLAVTQAPNWDSMNFMLDSDTVLGATASFDQHIKDAVDQPGPGNSSENWSSIKSSLDLQDQRRVRIFGSKTLELSMMLLFLISTPFLLTLLNTESTPVEPKEDVRNVILADAESVIDIKETITNTELEQNIKAPSVESNLDQSNTIIAQSASSITTESANVGSNNTVDANEIVAAVSNKNIITSEINRSSNEKETTFISPLVLNDNNEMDAIIAANSNENIDSGNTFEGLPLRTLLIDRDYSIDGLDSDYSVSEKFATKKTLTNWIPFVGAFAGTQVVELELQRFDGTYKTIDDKKLSFNGGVMAGLSNGNLDFSVGVGRMALNYKGGTEREVSEFYSDTINAGEIQQWAIGYHDSKISGFVLPVSAKVYMPLVDEKLDLYINTGITGTKITRSPVGYSDKFVKWLVGGPINPNPDDPIGGDFPDDKPTVPIVQKKSTQYYVDANFGLGLSYKLNKRMNIYADINMDIPLSEKVIGAYKDSWKTHNQLNMGVKYFLK